MSLNPSFSVAVAYKQKQKMQRRMLAMPLLPPKKPPIFAMTKDRHILSITVNK